MAGQTPKPLVGLVLGDPAGIGPELAARLAADSMVADAVRLLIIGDRRIFDRGAEITGTHAVVTPSARTNSRTCLQDNIPFSVFPASIPPRLSQGERGSQAGRLPWPTSARRWTWARSGASTPSASRRSTRARCANPIPTTRTRYRFRPNISACPSATSPNSTSNLVYGAPA
jgi:hypothetical protein